MNILEMIAGAAEDDEDEGLTHEQTVNRLREISALRAESHTFVPGQIVIHKHPASASIKSAHEPHMFVRYLEQPIRLSDHLEKLDHDNITSAMVCQVFDCEMVSLRKGGLFVSFMMDSAAFKPHPDYPVEG